MDINEQTTDIDIDNYANEKNLLCNCKLCMKRNSFNQIPTHPIEFQITLYLSDDL